MYIPILKYILSVIILRQIITNMRKLPFVMSVMLAVSCGTGRTPALTKAEKELISSPGETMRVLTIDSRADSLFLRKKTGLFNAADLSSAEFELLSKKMVATMTSPEQDGVGIAGPQVGIARRIIAVQRFDKEGEPVEVYANPFIVETRGEKMSGPEGCLSVPDFRGDVSRWQDITVSYSSGGKEVREDIKGFTAVIFQHETDHLEGILYIDKIN